MVKMYETYYAVIETFTNGRWTDWLLIMSQRVYHIKIPLAHYHVFTRQMICTLLITNAQFIVICEIENASLKAPKFSVNFSSY